MWARHTHTTANGRGLQEPEKGSTRWRTQADVHTMPVPRLLPTTTNLAPPNDEGSDADEVERYTVGILKMAPKGLCARPRGDDERHEHDEEGADAETKEGRAWLTRGGRSTLPVPVDHAPG